MDAVLEVARRAIQQQYKYANVELIGGLADRINRHARDNQRDLERAIENRRMIHDNSKQFVLIVGYLGESNHTTLGQLSESGYYILNDGDHYEADQLADLGTLYFFSSSEVGNILAMALEFVSDSYRPEPKCDAERFDRLRESLGVKHEQADI